MIKKKIYLAIIFALFTNNVLSQEIRISEINIIGNERIENNTVLVYSGLEVNNNYSNEIGNKALKKLFETDLFSDVKMQFLNGVLDIEVSENPTINLIIFSGNKKKSDEDLMGEISLGERSIYSRSKVKKDINKILTLYQRSGRLSAEVNPKVEILEDNRVNLIFEINESDIVTVSKITFIGNKVFSSRELRKVMKTKSSNLFRFFSSSDNYDPDKLEYDKTLISRLYNNSGYPNFAFKSSFSQLIPNRNSFEIILSVDEGEEYKFNEIIFDNKLKKINVDYLKAILPLETNDLYSSEKIKDSISVIKNNSASYGYNFIKINVDERYNHESRIVDVIFNIDEGPKVYINKIDINGNNVTIDKVIRRQIMLAEGDSYSKFLVDNSKNKIQSLGYFSKVDVTEVKDESHDKINLIYEVEERNTGEATIGAGYSSTSKANIQFGIKEENFLGKGQQLRFAAEFGDEYTTYDISFAEPYLYNRDLYIKTDFYNDLQDSASVNYETEKLGFGFSLGFPLSYNERIITRYSRFTDEITADSDATSYEKLLAGSTTVSSIGYTFSSDKRNSPYKPSSGYKYELVQDLAGVGGDANFLKSTFNNDFYKRINNSLIASIKLKLGHIDGYDDKFAPITSFYNLGGKKLRGFQSQRVGPKSGNSYTGGQYFYLLSTETNIDLPIENFDITSTLFIDLGSVWGLDERFGLIDDGHEIRASTGINFIWDSAIGPINFIFAEILKKQNTDSIDKFYFDIGYSF